MSYDLLRTTGTSLSFAPKTNPILPAKYQNVITHGVTSYAIALGIEDIVAKYQQLLPYIPNINVDYSKAEYAIIEHTSGVREVVALAWIEESTIQSSQRVNKILQLYDVPSTIDDKLIRSLGLLGITNYKLTDV